MGGELVYLKGQCFEWVRRRIWWEVVKVGKNNSEPLKKDPELSVVYFFAKKPSQVSRPSRHCLQVRDLV